METFAICAATGFCSFFAVCAMTLGLNAAEKAGVVIFSVGLLVGGALGLYFAAYPVPEVEHLEGHRLLLIVMRAVLLTSFFGASLFTGSAAWRTWRERRRLFPFLCRR